MLPDATKALACCRLGLAHLHCKACRGFAKHHGPGCPLWRARSPSRARARSPSPSRLADVIGYDPLDDVDLSSGDSE